MANLFLKSGRPTSAKEKAIEAVTDTSDEVPPIAPEEEEPPPAAAEPAATAPEPAPKPTKPKMQRFNVDLPVELHQELKMQAIREGVKLNALAIRLFTEYLKQASND